MRKMNALLQKINLLRLITEQGYGKIERRIEEAERKLSHMTDSMIRLEQQLARIEGGMPGCGKNTPGTVQPERNGNAAGKEAGEAAQIKFHTRIRITMDAD